MAGTRKPRSASCAESLIAVSLSLGLGVAQVPEFLAHMPAALRNVLESGVATGGMIPKLETAMAAVRAGVEAVVILDGRRPHAMLVELFTEFGAGTLVAFIGGLTVRQPS